MKRIIKNLAPVICIIMVFCFFESCKKLVGLDLQENVAHPTYTIDPRINKTAWQFIKERSSGIPDSICYQMYRGIIYSGIDTSEYTKTGRTFIVLHNDAVIRIASNKVTTDCYFGKYLVNNKPATRWEDYTPAQVKTFLQYLILQGDYNYFFGSQINPSAIALNAIADTATTLLPIGADTLNPKSIMLIGLGNDRNSSVQLNNFLGSAYSTTIRTAGIIPTNGTIHVADRVVYFKQN